MNATIRLLLLVAALPASAQTFVSPDQLEGFAAAADSARVTREKFSPAPVDPEPVRILRDRLVRNGEQVEMPGAIGNVYMRLGAPDAGGHYENLQINLVEIPAEYAEAPSENMVRRAVMTRYFSHLEATVESWSVNPKTGEGSLEVWVYRVGLGGTLQSVERRTAPVAAGAPVEAKADFVRMAPSDRGVQERWRALSKRLLTLGRSVVI